MLVLSAAAQAEVQRLAQQWGLEQGWFRLEVRSGGCRSLTYVLQFHPPSQAIGPDEQALEGDGWRAIVRDHDLPYLRGLTIDYSEDLVVISGFKIPMLATIAVVGTPLTMANRSRSMRLVKG